MTESMKAEKELKPMKRIDLNFYPGWTRKAITFTIDDGNVELDKKFFLGTKTAKNCAYRSKHRARSKSICRVLFCKDCRLRKAAVKVSQ